MKNFLSIGEVSKIKGVSTKSLRYYEQLGILTPAYVNPETGYRYYTTEQLLIVDLITICIETSIPLKNLQKYMTDQQNINIQHLLVDGEQIIDQKIEKLQKAKQFLSSLSTHILRTNRVKLLGTPFIEDFSDRYFLTSDYENDISDYRMVHAQYSKLVKQATDLEISDSFNQGFLVIQKKGNYKRKIFLEIPNPRKEIENLLVIKSRKFSCKVQSFQNFFNIQSEAEILIVIELFDLTINPTERLIEVQEAVHS